MKRLTNGFSLFIRLASTAAVLCMSQQAMAVGTGAGDTVSNQASVTYRVGNVDQAAILSDGDAGTAGVQTTDFIVDNRVDFNLVESGLLTHTIDVTPGQTDQFVQFTLTNTGNATQDWRLVVTDLDSTDPDVHGLTDSDVNMDNVRIFVDANDNGTLEIGTDLLGYVDELDADESVVIFVVADAGTALTNGDIINIDLEAITADAGTANTLGSDTANDFGSGDTAGIDVVFAEGFAAGGGTTFTLGDGRMNAQDGFIIASAELTITKAATLLSDPFNGTTNPKAIPGATVQYVVTVVNGGTQNATNVVIADILTDTTLLSDTFGAAEVQINNAGSISTCTEDAEATPDQCVLTGSTLTVGLTAPATGLDVAGGTNMTITFQVTIN